MSQSAIKIIDEAYWEWQQANGKHPRTILISKGLMDELEASFTFPHVKGQPFLFNDATCKLDENSTQAVRFEG